jgi:hypothetical protein
MSTTILEIGVPLDRHVQFERSGSTSTASATHLLYRVVQVYLGCRSARSPPSRVLVVLRQVMTHRRNPSEVTSKGRLAPAVG